MLDERPKLENLQNTRSADCYGPVVSGPVPQTSCLRSLKLGHTECTETAFVGKKVSILLNVHRSKECRLSPERLYTHEKALYTRERLYTHEKALYTREKLYTHEKALYTREGFIHTRRRYTSE